MMAFRRVLLMLTLLQVSVLAFPQSEDHFRGWRVVEDRLYVHSTPYYNAMKNWERQDVVNQLTLPSPNISQILIRTGTTGRELWLREGNGFVLVERWDTVDMSLAEYQPKKLERNGESRLYYSFGGALSVLYAPGQMQMGSQGYFRVGTFLYKNYLDASASIQVGFQMTASKDDNHYLNVVTGLSSRAYLPFRFKGASLAPYIGAGASFAVAPNKFFELQILSGLCWIIGSGNLDIGVQYGLKSKFAVTLGYTFRPSFGK